MITQHKFHVTVLLLGGFLCGDVSIRTLWNTSRSRYTEVSSKLAITCLCNLAISVTIKRVEREIMLFGEAFA